MASITEVPYNIRIIHHGEYTMNARIETIQDVERMTLEEIEAAIPSVEAEITGIEAQLGNAIAERQLDNKVNDDWQARARTALSMKKQRLAVLEATEKRLMRERKCLTKRGHISLERAFMSAAKLLLRPETYQMLLEEARARIE
jgi:hypothetical protein